MNSFSSFLLIKSAIHLNPVRVIKLSMLYDLAILSRIVEVTIVEAVKALLGSDPWLCLWFSIKLKSTAAVWLPFKRMISSKLFLTAIPTRSASGSQPITISAFISLDLLIAMLSASCSSGFGDIRVGKLPSGIAWDSIISTYWKPVSYTHLTLPTNREV